MGKSGEYKIKMKVEVLLSCMNQEDFSIVEKANIRTDAIIVNQCNCNCIELKEYPFGKVFMINTTERGLSKSRNMALKYSTGDICIICDDDEVLSQDYESRLIDAFSNVNADIIVFNIISKNLDRRPQEKLFKEIRRIPFYKSYSSVHIAFKRLSIINKEIKFNEVFGAGSGFYSFAEDSLFFSDIHRKRLKAYSYPAIIAELYTEGSSWFEGFNEKYFFDTGAFLSASYPHLKYFFMWYYPLRLHKKSEISIFNIVKYIMYGMKCQKSLCSYEKFLKGRKDGYN